MEIEHFLKKLSSEEPAPGGGTASALSGSMGAALVAMVAKLSTKEASNAKTVSEQSEKLMQASLQLAKEDERAFDAVIAAYKLPKGSDSEKAARSAAIEKALKTATEIPLQSAKTSIEILELAASFLKNANKNAISDVGVAALLAKAAAEGAILNVLINLASIKDQSFAQSHLRQTEKVIEAGEQKLHAIMKSVYETLRAPLSTEPV